MAQWVCQVLLPCLPREAFLRSRMGRLAVVSLLPPPGGRTAFVQEQTDQRASALPACWPWPWPSAHQGPRPSLPSEPRLPPLAASSPWTQSAHTAQRPSSKRNKRNCLGPHGCGPHLHTRAEPPEPSLYPGVHWTLPTPSVQHGPDLWTDDWAATPRLSWPSLAPRPPHTSASHSASKIPQASQEEPACQARTRKAQLQHGPWVHRFGRRYEQGPHSRTWAPRANASSLPPAHLGFVPQAQFIFAKNCSQVWAEALNGFTQLSGGQGSQELPEEAKGEKDVEKDQEPKPEAEQEPELGQEAEQASPYSMDDSDPRKFFMSGFTGYVPRARFLFGSSFPVLSNQALQEFGEMKSPGRSQKDPKHLPVLSRTYPQHLGLLPKYGGYVPGYKFQFGRTYGHLTQDALALSTLQKQLPV